MNNKPYRQQALSISCSMDGLLVYEGMGKDDHCHDGPEQKDIGRDAGSILEPGKADSFIHGVSPTDIKGSSLHGRCLPGLWSKLWSRVL